MNKPLEGQTILVTGASGDIGSAIVEQLAANGARAIIHYGRDKIKAEALLARIHGHGVIIQADLSAPDGAFDLWHRSVTAAGRIHGLVNNAGIRSEISIDANVDAWHAAWRAEFQVNLFAAADLCRAAIEHFKAHGGGRIVNMSSRAAQRGYAANALPYGASKAALANLTKSIARAFGGDGITAVNICPGWVATRMADDPVAAGHGTTAAMAEIPIGALASCAEIAELVAFVLRPTQASLNGATMDVNGGSYIR